MMHFGNAILDILLLVLAVVAVLRLRRALGRRPDSFPRPHEREAAPLDAQEEVKPEASSEASEQPLEEARLGRRIFGASSPSIDEASREALDAIARAEKGFGVESFLKGARGAYKMIVTAFAEGEKTILRGLLEKEIYEQFAQSIEGREARGESASVQITSFLEARILGAELVRGTARIRMRFRTEQISYVEDSEGRVIEGDPNSAQGKIDFWVFARRLGSSDPSWALSATGA